MLHGIPSKYTFEFKHANTNVQAVSPKLAWQLSIYSININIAAEPYVIIGIIVVYLISRRVCKCDRVIVRRTPSNDSCECKHAPKPTYRLFVTVLLHKPINISAEPCAIVIVVYVNSSWVCNCDSVVLHFIPSNYIFRHAPTPTYLLFVQREHGIVPYMPSRSARSHLPLPVYPGVLCTIVMVS